MPRRAGSDVFISYAHEDDDLRAKLEKHLKLLERQGLVRTWHDRRILPGGTWAGEIDANLEAANIVLLLVSADFIASDYCWEVETRRAMERHEAGDACVIPVILRPCEWQEAPFGKLQALPKDAKPVVTWAVQDEAWLDVAQGVRKVIEDQVELSQPSHKDDVLTEWFKQVEEDHRRLADHFERPVELEDLEKAWVRLELGLPEQAAAIGGVNVERSMERRTLDHFLALDPADHPWVTRRWLVEGDPGSGKTTLLRHLAGRLARKRESRSIPVFVSLPRLVAPSRLLLDYLAEEFSTVCGAELPNKIDQLGREGRLAVLLDGFDEVPPERRDRARRIFDKLGRDWPESSVVLASRPIGLGKPPPGYHKLVLQPLDDDHRRQFLEKWFHHRKIPEAAAEAAQASTHFDSTRGLRELSHNPLHLTLLTILWEKGVRAPRRRSELYDAIIELLLEGRHKDSSVAIPGKAVVRQALRHLAYSLTRDDLLEEEPEQLERRLLDDELDTTRVRLEKVWGKNLRAFLEEVRERTYILGPHDGPRAAWRFWHRTFREALTAERLEEIYRDRGEGMVLAQAMKIEGDLGRWAEPFALLAGRLADSDRLVTRLVQVNRPLGLRALATAQGLKAETFQEILGLSGGWEERQKIFERIPEQFDDPEPCLALIDQLRHWTHNGNDLFFLFRTIEEVTVRWAAAIRRARDLKDRFFDHIPPPEDTELFRSVDTRLDGKVELWCEIPAGEGWIGSSKSEKGRFAWEGPRFRVSMARSYRLAVVPVTNEQYAAFDPDRAQGQKPNYPICGVTWQEAVSFCRWLAARVPGCAGARLPREEEWEYACRAGSVTAYWTGNREKGLAKVGWYDKNSGGSTHAVAEKLANPWGLYDVHGNVWEWTASIWTNAYSNRVSGIKLDATAEPVTAPANGSYVLRGGSCLNDADRTRSAYRVRIWVEDLGQGFRVLLPECGSRSRIGS